MVTSVDVLDDAFGKEDSQGVVKKKLTYLRKLVPRRLPSGSCPKVSPRFPSGYLQISP